jgi:deoxynucleoside kinase
MSSLKSIKHSLSVFLEGNIGCGKTSFLNHFKKFEDVCLLEEPIEK